MTAYQEFISKGGRESEWDSFREKKNEDLRIHAKLRIVLEWNSGQLLNGNDIVNLMRSLNVEFSETVKRALQHDDTQVSCTLLVGRGIKKSEAKKLHKFVVGQMNQLDYARLIREQLAEEN